jgi:glycosyltransferase involved in cell wall biosynthesis
MRILQVVPDLISNGAQAVCVHLACCMRAGAEVHVASLYDKCGSPLEKTLDHHHIPLWHVGKRRGVDLSVIYRLLKLVNCLRPDVIHTHMNALYYILLAAKIKTVPVLVHTVHTDAYQEPPRLGRALSTIAFHAGVVPVAVAEAVSDTVRKKYRASNVPVIPNGICVSEFDWTTRERIDCRRNNCISKDTLLFVTLARVDLVKGIDILLEAFRIVRSRCKTCALWIVGDGPLRAHLEQATKELENVWFLGHRNDVRRLLAAADVFVLPSRYEASPLALLEAMAAGKPVIATAVGGIPEILHGNQQGFLVQPESPTDLAQAMILLASDHNARIRMGTNAREWARHHFTSGRMAAAYMELYKNLLVAKACSPSRVSRVS